MKLRRPLPRSTPLGVLVTAVVASALTTVFLTAPGTVEAAHRQPEAFASFLVVALLFQALAVDVYNRGSISVAGIGLLAAGFALGPGPAVAVAVAMAVAHAIRKRRPLYKTLYNAGVFALAAAAAAELYGGLTTTGSAGLTRFAAACFAGAVFTVVNIGLMTTAMGVAERLRLTVVWRERFRWLTPHYVAFGPMAFALSAAYASLGLAGLLAFTLPPALLVLSVRQYLNRTRAAVDEIRLANDELTTANSALLDANSELRTLADRVRKTHRDTIAALSRSMEAKDQYTSGHTERVAVLSVEIARSLGFDGDDLAAIEIGALLHDIGKIAVPESILHKPGPLNDEEWVVMKQHPVVSETILSAVDLHPFVCQIARWSHERIDGAGYPDGLAGDDIPLPARIVLVADAFDALTTDRPYRAGRSAAAAMEELRGCAGTQFCSRALDGLEALYRNDPGLLGTDTTPPLADAA